MKQIAVITGASSGMGREFAYQIAAKYKKLDELWLVARRKERLEAMKEELSVPVRVIAADLTKEDGIDELRKALKEENVRIRMLVASAGCGRMGDFDQVTYEGNQTMIRLNCEALTAVTYICLPYMPRSGRILFLASSAAFAPQPGFAVYAASKAFVLSFSRALREELKTRKISVTAVCPGPVDTEFFEAAGSSQKISAIKKLSMAKPEPVVAKALRDAALGNDISVYGYMMKGSLLASKLLPHPVLVPLMNAMLNKK